MSIAGAVQLVKYIRKTYPQWHRWIGRFYIIASLIASTGGTLFCLTKGSYGGKQADYAFVTYGIIFWISGVKCYYHATRKQFHWHKLWAWRLYSLSLAAWLYRFDYYWWMVLFGKGQDSWLHREDYLGAYDFFINWAFYVHHGTDLGRGVRLCPGHGIDLYLSRRRATLDPFHSQLL